MTTDHVTDRIPLSHLTECSYNVRAGERGDISELAATILAHGLLSSLVVRRNPDINLGGFVVIAGHRRLAALKYLLVQGAIDPDYTVPCQVVETDSTDFATEMSLAENVAREPMHPADEFTAFKTLIDRGVEIADIAARFGVSDTVVRKRLKLANLAPEVLQAYRDGKLTLSQVQAFAITDDQARQVKLLDDVDEDTDDDTIRTALSKGRIPATDKRVKFVTMARYEEAGGTVSRDLFCTDDNGIFIEDPQLLEDLLLQQLQTESDKLKAEGWAFVEFTTGQAGTLGRRVWPDNADIPDSDQKRIDELHEENNTIRGKANEEDRKLTPEEQERINAIDDEIERLEDTPEIWTDEEKANCVVVLRLDRDGGLERDVYTRAEAAPKKKTATEENAESEEDNEEESGGGSGIEISGDLLYTLSEHRSAALAEKLAENVDVALATCVYALGMTVLYGAWRTDPFTVEMEDKFDDLNITADDCKAVAQIEKEKDAWTGKLPEESDDFWDWCMEAKRQKLLNLLSYIMSRNVDATGVNQRRLTEGDRLAEVLQLDMADHFTPTAENYFKPAGKMATLAALKEAHNLTEIPDAWAKLKLEELAPLAEREIAGTGWIPECLKAAPEEPESEEEDGEESDEFADDDAAVEDAA